MLSKGASDAARTNTRRLPRVIALLLSFDDARAIERGTHSLKRSPGPGPARIRMECIYFCTSIKKESATVCPTLFVRCVYDVHFC
jgi:hypothetical protein